jgi:membrane-associated protease RseP (regulator of RpoE activity)
MTFITTMLAGSIYVGVIPWMNPEKIHLGLPFSLTIMLILMTHEFSHYYFSRKHRVPATLPYFIPAPSLIGTFGAVIKMKPPIPDRRALIDIGASGPIGGFIVAVLAVIIGLNYSEIMPLDGLPAHEPDISFGESLLLVFLTKLILNIDPDKYAVLLHPVAFAGWVGLFVTSLNLLPISQLDGGHIIYAFLGEKHIIVSKGMIPVLFVMSLVYLPWIILLIIIFFIGYRHPPVVHPWIELDRKRKAVGWVCLFIFILTFTPVPIKGL